MEYAKDLTILIPFHYDCAERLRNVVFVVSMLEATNANVLIYEMGKVRNLSRSMFPKSIRLELLFEKNVNGIFHRTYCINKMLRLTKTRLAGVWDADVVVSNKQIEEACVRIISNGDVIAYPYDGSFMLLSQESTTKLCQSSSLDLLNELEAMQALKRPSCGGAFIVDVSKYLSIGGENENFTGWGPEDAERLHRCLILGMGAHWNNFGKLYHLYHPILKSNFTENNKNLLTMRREFVNVCMMNSDKLNEYIKSMKNVHLPLPTHTGNGS